ncbi:methionine aminopeptidase 1A [Rosa chinensis]|uniref:methionine aminopeptidase 1A n=1 Tax=Rosa chinensis TaxID=74649 RepID=UPI001AD8C2F1|nr:methionine aminopeptidase 1A [Rosa chinensis]
MEIWTLISTQDCFKASWSLHKLVHLKAKQSNGAGNPENEGWQYCMKKGQGRTPKLPYFDWTGTLRPYPISSKRVVPSHIDLPDWAADVSFGIISM